MKDLYEIFTEGEFCRMLNKQTERQLRYIVDEWDRDDVFHEPTRDELREMGIAV